MAVRRNVNLQSLIKDCQKLDVHFNLPKVCSSQIMNRKKKVKTAAIRLHPLLIELLKRLREEVAIRAWLAHIEGSELQIIVNLSQQCPWEANPSGYGRYGHTGLTRCALSWLNLAEVRGRIFMSRFFLNNTRKVNMGEFRRINLTNKVPEDGICPACASHGIVHEPTQTSFVYCKHNATGAFQSSSRPWNVFPRIDVDIFRAAVLRGIIGGELRVEIVRDMKNLITDGANHSVRH